jgi:hypothetical protein
MKLRRRMKIGIIAIPILLLKKVSIVLKQTSCIKCKENVKMIDSKYIRLTNSRLVMQGSCYICYSKLLKTKVMPKSHKGKEIDNNEKKK